MSYLDKTGCEFLVRKTKSYVDDNKPQLRTYVGRIPAQITVGKEARPKDLEFYPGDGTNTIHTGQAEKYFDVDDYGYIYLKKAPTGKTGVTVLINFQIYAYNGYTAGKKLYVHIRKAYKNTAISSRIEKIKYIYYIPVTAPYLVFSGHFYYFLEEDEGITLDVYSSDGKGTIGCGDGFDTHLALTTVI